MKLVLAITRSALVVSFNGQCMIIMPPTCGRRPSRILFFGVGTEGARSRDLLSCRVAALAANMLTLSQGNQITDIICCICIVGSGGHSNHYIMYWHRRDGVGSQIRTNDDELAYLERSSR